MKKIDIIRAVVLMQEMGIIPKIVCYNIISQIIHNTKYKKLGGD